MKSALPGGESDVGNLEPAKRGAEIWGDPKDRDREKVLQVLKEKFPERYRELVEQYYKSLANEKSSSETAPPKDGK
jgi:hypothetical protein